MFASTCARDEISFHSGESSSCARHLGMIASSIVRARPQHRDRRSRVGRDAMVTRRGRLMDGAISLLLKETVMLHLIITKLKRILSSTRDGLIRKRQNEETSG